MENIFEIAYNDNEKTIVKVNNFKTIEYLIIPKNSDLFTVIHSTGKTVTVDDETILTPNFSKLRREARKFARTHI